MFVRLIVLLSILVTLTQASKGVLSSNNLKSKNWRSSSSHVVCTHTTLVTTVTFSDSFYGTVYAKGHSHDCQVTGNGTKSIRFQTDVRKCGVRVRDVDGVKELELYLYVQHDPYIQQSNDERILVRCMPQEIHVSGAMGRRQDQFDLRPNVKKVNGDSRILVKTMSNHHLAESTVNSVECVMDIMKGRLPFLKPIDSFVDIGEDVTVLLKIKNILGIDSRVARCFAHDGSEGTKHDLTDEDGCTLDANIMPNFKSLFSESSSSKILHTSFPAFKFPDRSNLHIQCTVVICNTTCPKFECDNTAQLAHHLAKRYVNSEARTLPNKPRNLTNKGLSQIGVSTFIAVNEQFSGYESSGIVEDLLGEQTLSCFTLPSIIIVFTLLSTSFFASLIVALFMSSKVCLLKKRLAAFKAQLKQCEDLDCFGYANAIDMNRHQ